MNYVKYERKEKVTRVNNSLENREKEIIIILIGERFLDGERCWKKTRIPACFPFPSLLGVYDTNSTHTGCLSHSYG